VVGEKGIPGLLAELAELAVLVAMSLILVVGVIFRPTGAGVSRKKVAVSAREETARKVLGADPTREAAQIYRKLLRDAHIAGVTIDWERARREQVDMRPKCSLVAAARSQIRRS
jgi:ABC-type sulfate transport system permease component